MIFNWQTLRRSRDPAHFELSCKSAGGVVAAAAADADVLDVAVLAPSAHQIARCLRQRGRSVEGGLGLASYVGLLCNVTPYI